MELLLIFFIFCLSKNHLLGFSSYERKNWNQVFFVNEFPGAQLYVDGFPAGISESGPLFFPPDRDRVNVQYLAGDQVLLDSELLIQGQKTFFLARMESHRLLCVK